MKKILLIVWFILIIGEIFAQYPPYYNPEKKFVWIPISLNGELSSYGHYRTQELDYDYLSDSQKSYLFSVGGMFDFKSYLWHPDFLLLNIEAEYNPYLIREDFIVIPDQAETRTTKRLQFSGTLFNNKVITLNSIANFAQVYQNRENLTNVKTDSKQLGGMLSFSNRKLPVQISFYHTVWKQEETESGRITNMDRFYMDGKLSKTFFRKDKHDFTYHFDKNIYDYFDVYETRTRSHFFNLIDYIPFDKDGNYILRSLLSYRSQKGTIEFNRFQADENLSFKLPLHFKFNSNYGYNLMMLENQRINNQHFKNVLSHQLFLSLNSNIYQEYRKSSNSVYQEKDYIFGGNLSYTKKLPLKGRLNLNYNYQRQDHTSNSDPVSIQVVNETHLLTDGQITLLERPYADISSVVVKDETGAVIYIENIDYILIERNAYIEIQRFPGGQISNGATVYVDYTVNVPETYAYDSNMHRITGSISLFKGLFEIYAGFSNHNFVHLEEVDLLILNYLTQYRYGFRIDLKYASAGIEYEDYQSTVIPYEMIRCYVSANKNFKDRVLISLNGNIQKYKLVNEDIEQMYSDISAKIVYRIIDQTKASMDLGYRKQIGYGIDLDLLTARFEITSQIRQFMFTVGLEKYKRNFLDQINNYSGIYFKLTRRF